MVPAFLDLLNDPDAFKRERKKGHFTASAWIVNKRRTHTLLTLHRKLQRWLQLGGHADGDENLVEVALKEAKEESGLQSIQLVDKSIKRKGIFIMMLDFLLRLKWMNHW